MRVAIHHSPGSFSEIWIKYCQEQSVSYKIVNAYDSDIISQIEDCNVFMWHHHHSNYRDALFAKQLLFSLEQSGKLVFPDCKTGWHFDDKLGQKYLFEALGIQAAPAWAFYDKTSAIAWAKGASYPKVFKLRSGAGSSNVKLVRSFGEACGLIKKAFGKGFLQNRGWDYVKESYAQFRARNKSFLSFFRSCGRLFFVNEFTRMHAPEKGYIYFQDFVPNEGYDVRITVVGNRAIAFRRLVRQNDFRASASGFPIWDNENTPATILEAAFALQKVMDAQTVSVDYVLSKTDGTPFVVEVSYGFGFPREAGTSIPNTPTGYWTDDLSFHIASRFSPVEWMLEDCLHTNK